MDKVERLAEALWKWRRVDDGISRFTGDPRRHHIKEAERFIAALSAAGLEVVEKDKDEPNEIACYVMRDNHTFAKPNPANTVEQLVSNMLNIAQPYDMLCPAILLRNGTEIRRVGKPVHIRAGGYVDSTDVEQLKAALQNDPDVPRLLASALTEGEG